MVRTSGPGRERFRIRDFRGGAGRRQTRDVDGRQRGLLRSRGCIGDGAGAHVNASVSGGHGTVTEATQTIDYGASATIHINPEANYHIASITDNGATKTIANPYVINNVNAAHTVVVTFAQDRSPDSIRYLPEGSTNWGFDCYVSIANPNTEAIHVKLTYMTSSGPGNRPHRCHAGQEPGHGIPVKHPGGSRLLHQGGVHRKERPSAWTGPCTGPVPVPPAPRPTAPPGSLPLPPPGTCRKAPLPGGSSAGCSSRTPTAPRPTAPSPT